MCIDTMIMKTIQQLNAEEIVPFKAYRRDVVVHQLVCHVNHLIGCYISKNYYPMKIIINRVHLYLEDYETDEQSEKYVSLVLRFIEQLESENITEYEWT